MLKGVDFSVYQGVPGRAWFQDVYDAGYRVAVVGSWHGDRPNPHVAENLYQARMVGFHTGTYVALNSQPGNWSVDQGKLYCQQEWEHLSFVGIDCEIGGITPDIIEQAVQRTIRLGQTPWMYTAFWWWTGTFLNNQEFQHLPLWTADYDGQQNLAFSPPYGGWDKLAAKQYAGTTPLFGVGVDLDTFDESLFNIKEEDLAYLIEVGGPYRLAITDGITKRHITSQEEASYQRTKLGNPAVVSQVVYNSIPNISSGATGTHQHTVAATVTLPN